MPPRRGLGALVFTVALALPLVPAWAQARIALRPVVGGGLSAPLYVTHARDGSGRLFVVEQGGRILVVKGGVLSPTPFLDVRARVIARGEQGLLGLTFHPDYRQSGRFFVNYTRRPDGATVVAEFRASSVADLAAPSSERVLLVIEQPYSNHNGGMIEFGPDGFLYVGMGDGGAAGDPQNRAQNPNDLLGKMLRIDVDARSGPGSAYAIPPDNPFAAGGGRAEIYATGLRNPWRFAFDRETGQLWAGDVGQRAWEEIDVIRRGGNYGWRLMEGAHCYHPPYVCQKAGLELPVAAYANGGGRCSITGGYVYRGREVPALSGAYVFGDFCSGEIFTLVDGTPRVLLKTGMAISSFGEDEAGEVYVVDHKGGAVHRIVRDAASH